VAEIRRLVLVRHAKSDYPWGVADHARPLNERGRRDAPAAGRWLGQHVEWPSGGSALVLVSTARRAQLTWSLARAELPAPWSGVEQRDEGRIYEASAAELVALVREAPREVSTLLLVGHNPGLVDLIEGTAAPGEATARATAKFPTSAIAVLDVPGPWSALGRSPCTLHDFAVPRG
jgi:phosphohistidine phosphatase